MSGNKDHLKELIQNGLTDQAIELVRNPDDYHEGESLVFAVLGEEKSAPTLVEAVLEAFMATRENRYRKHGSWVHSLSHFTKHLWERRMDDWIKRFNEIAFKGANELDDSNCSDRLVGDFASYAKWDDDPVAFGLTLDNLRWMKPDKYNQYSRARIEAGKFATEEAYLRWHIRQPSNQVKFDFDAQTDLVDGDGIRKVLNRLQELGADVSEFDGFEFALLSKQFAQLECKLPTATVDWEIDRVKKGMEKTRTALAQLPSPKPTST